MNLRTLIRPAGIAMAAALLAGSVASAASPAGDDMDFDVEFRDELGQVAVLAVYPYSDGTTNLSSLRIRGPRVAWQEDHPLPQGTVKWRVTVKVAPTKNGPWTVESRTRGRTLLADRTGPLEQFKARTVNFDDRGGRFFVRVNSRLIFVNEDGGVYTWIQHAYEKYGLVMSSGIPPAFGDETETRSIAAPNRWNPN